MSLYDKTRLKSAGNGVEIGQNALTDTDLLADARMFKSNVASRYKLYSEGDIASMPEEEYYTSIKLDGQLHYLCKADGEIFLFNPRGRVIRGLALVPEAAEALSAVDNVLLAGELYIRNAEERSRVYAVTSALGEGSDSSSLAFGAFSLLRLNGESHFGEAFSENLEAMKGFMPSDGAFHLIEQKLIKRSEIGSEYDREVIGNSHEGLICRAADTPFIYKVKPRHTVDAAIIGFTERPDEPGSMRVLLTALMRPDGTFQLFTKVGTGFDDSKRRELFRLLKDDVVASDFKETDRNHTLFTMVEPKHVIEVSFHDIIQENAAGRPQMRAVLEYSAEEGYKACLQERFIAVLFPVFKGIREDKGISIEDLRMTQLREMVDLDNLESGSRHLELAASEILHREVYTKETKGLTSVRKFIGWKTNKEDIDDSYPPYVFCYVDYSPGRKAPMRKVLRIAQNAAGLQSLFSAFKEKEIKKGWKPVE